MDSLQKWTLENVRRFGFSCQPEEIKRRVKPTKISLLLLICMN